MMQHQNRRAPERNTDPEHKRQQVGAEELRWAMEGTRYTKRQGR
jgi:hypothetical protein